MGITHLKVSGVTDGSDTDLVQPSDWNDPHVTLNPFDGAEVTPAAITGNVNNWDPWAGGDGDETIVWASSNASYDITGIVAKTEGFTFVLHNGGDAGAGGNLSLKFDSASSSAANRMGPIGIAGQSATLTLGTGTILRYHNSRWRVLSHGS